MVGESEHPFPSLIFSGWASFFALPCSRISIIQTCSSRAGCQHIQVTVKAAKMCNGAAVSYQGVHVGFVQQFKFLVWHQLIKKTMLSCHQEEAFLSVTAFQV